MNVMAPGMMIIFSGRRWVIQEVDDRDKVIMVNPSKGGTSPIFSGDPGDIHDVVIQRMFKVLEGHDAPTYMDQVARDLLDEARRNYAELGFANSSISALSERSYAIATRVGTVKTNTLALALRGFGFAAETHDGFVSVVARDEEADLKSVLMELATGSEVQVFGDQINLIFEKFHPYLTRDLLQADAPSARVASLKSSLRRLAQLTKPSAVQAQA